MNRWMGLAGRLACMGLMLSVMMMSVGCATPMALSNSGSGRPAAPGQGLVVMVAETSKADGMGSSLGKGAIPTIQTMKVAPLDSGKSIMYMVHRSLTKGTVPLGSFMGFEQYGQGNHFIHLLSFALPEGTYEVNRIEGKANHKKGAFGLAPKLRFLAVAGKVVYAGHINLHMREVVPGEMSVSRVDGANYPQAGALVNLLATGIENRMIGFNKGVFELTVSDNLDTDRKLFVDMFPKLNGVEFERGLAIPAKTER